MSLKDDLLPLVDEYRGIAGELGFRPYQVWVRKTSYAGPRAGLGARTVTDTRLLVGGQDPKVRIVRNKDVASGTSEFQATEFEIGPLTPEFAGGGVPEDVVYPERSSTPTTVLFLLKGPGLPDEGLFCQRISAHVDHSLHAMLRVQSTGRRAPA